MNLLKHKLRAFNYYARKKDSKEPIWLEYLESDGNQYIDTEYKPSNNTSYKIKFSLVSNLGRQNILGCRERRL